VTHPPIPELRVPLGGREPRGVAVVVRGHHLLVLARVLDGYEYAVLPGGGIEPGETAEDAAVREVEEETGIHGRVLALLGVIDFWFVAEQRRVHKTVHHFLLEAQRGELSDADIEVDQVAWVPLDELAGRLAYADERRLLEKVADLLDEPAGPAA